jgi:hypothetical protein
MPAFRWLWIHALEFAHLNRSILQIHSDASRPHEWSLTLTSPDSIPEADLTKKYTSVPRAMTPLNIFRAYGIDISCSTATARVRIDTLAYTFSLTNRPDVPSRLQSLDSASRTPLEGQPTQETCGVAAMVKKLRNQSRSDP